MLHERSDLDLKEGGSKSSQRAQFKSLLRTPPVRFLPCVVNGLKSKSLLLSITNNVMDMVKIHSY